MDRTCKHCGKKFHEKPSRVKRGQGIYCSWECFQLGYIKNQKERLRVVGSKRKWVVCPHCGKKFFQSRTVPSFCSKSCSNRSRKAVVAPPTHQKLYDIFGDTPFTTTRLTFKLGYWSTPGGRAFIRKARKWGWIKMIYPSYRVGAWEARSTTPAIYCVVNPKTGRVSEQAIKSAGELFKKAVSHWQLKMIKRGKAGINRKNSHIGPWLINQSAVVAR